MLTLKEKFGIRLQEMRKIKGFTQEKLAEKIGVDTPHISNIERGKYFVTAETLEKLAKVLQIEEKELFEFKKYSNREELTNNINTFINNGSIPELEFLTKVINNLQEMKVAK